jgi:hypothetical protein
MNWFGLKQLIKLHIPRFCNERAIDWWLRDVREGVVISGPFAGTRYISESYGSSHYPKLLGTYEKELAQIWEPRFLQSFDTIINIGCAEGYYLAGLGRLSRRENGQHAALIGYDLSEKAVDLCRRLLKQNGLGAQSLVAGHFDGEGLRNGRALVICDIEGAEKSEMDLARWPELAAAFIVIEVHDEPGESRMVELLQTRFAASHSVDHIRFAGRVADDFPQVKWPWFTPAQKEKMVDECRLNGKDWLVLRPHKSKDA